MTRYRAALEYDGTDYHGFQRQASERTVQGEVEAALARLNAHTAVTVYAAGRTDRGVHATGQVIAFDLGWRHGAAALTRALNAHLPPDASVREIEVVPDDFHPRYAARGRRYAYHIYNAPVRSPLNARTAWHVWPRLDLAALQLAASALVGRHDFATFGTAPKPGGHTIRNVRRAEWRAVGPLLTFEIEADAFLYRMVRSIVGTLRQVGAGALTPADVGTRLAAADRKQAGPAAPPHGLCLTEVLY